MGLGRTLDRVEQRLLRDPGDSRPEVERHLLPDHRRRREEGARIRAEAVYARVDHLPQQRRDADRREIAQRPTRVVAAQRAFFFERAQQFARVEGVPFGAAGEVGDQPGRGGGRQGVAAARQPGEVAAAQGPQFEPRRLALARQQRQQRVERVTARHLVGAVGRDQQERRGGETAGGDAQEVERGVVGPVQVVEEEHERPACGDGGEEPPGRGLERARPR